MYFKWQPYWNLSIFAKKVYGLVSYTLYFLKDASGLNLTLTFASNVAFVVNLESLSNAFLSN